MSAEPLVSQFVGSIQKAVDQFRDQGLTVAETLGALDLVHAEIIRDAFENGKDPEP